ncbi:MAG: hypothetical protein PHY02_11095, partial [Phycisphaerae bacterium]|nr:hypothetical protein [Phycisphaerae bacterium]
KEFYRTVKRKLVDFAAPIEDTLRTAQKKGGYEVLPESHITNQIDRVLRSPTMAGQFARDNGLEIVIKKVDNLNNLDQYMIAKHAQAVESRGIKTGRDLAKDSALIKEFAPKYEGQAKIVSDYSKKLLDYSVESGLVSKEVATMLKERYPDYVPIKRIFNELEASGQLGGSKAIASLSKQTVVQKLAGSEREIESPITSLLEKTAETFQQGEKNKAAGMLAAYKDLPGNPFDIIPLRTAENVKARIDLFGQAKELKPLQKKIERFLSANSKRLRVLGSEINKLEKRGLGEAVRKRGLATPDILIERLSELKTRDVRSIVKMLISEPNIKINKLKKMVATRENKIAPLLNKIENLKYEFDNIKEHRISLMDEARLLKDAESRGKSTFSVLKDGIKEIYETTPEIANAAKALNVQQLGVLGRIFAAPVRIAKLGITGLNLPFIAANVAKDQVTNTINAKHALRTSIANPAVFIKALFTAAGHGEVYKEMARNGSLGTSFDIARNQTPLSVKRIRAGRNVGSKILYTAIRPQELLRAAENIVNRGEELTRIQAYKGTKQGAMKEGRSEAAAQILASRAARENTVNFARRGEWGTVLNAGFLYINANIQGTRTFVRNFGERPIGTATKMALVVFTPVAIATAWNLSDDKRRAAYEDIEEWEKENNIIIVPPNPTRNKDGKWNVIKIPLSQEINNIASMARRPIEQAYGLDPVSVKDVAKALVGTVSPINPTKESMMSSLTPQIIKPTLESYTNTNLFTGKPIIPESLQGLEPEQQVRPYTSGTARKIGGGVGASPMKVEAFAKGTFGSIAPQALNISDRILAKAGAIPKEQIGGQSTAKAIAARFATAQGSYPKPEIELLRDKFAQQAFQKNWEDLGPLHQKVLRAKYQEIRDAEKAVKVENAQRESNYKYIAKTIVEQKKAGKEVYGKLNPAMRSALDRYGISLGLSRRSGDWTMNDERFAKYKQLTTKGLNKINIERIMGSRLSDDKKEKMVRDMIDIAKEVARTVVKQKSDTVKK